MDVDDDGFRTFVAVRGPALGRVALLLTGNPYDADDLLQESLARAYSRWRLVVRADDRYAYVRRLMTNLHVSRWRAAARRAEYPVAELPDVVGPGHDSQVVRADAVMRALAALPARQRAAVVLRYFEDLPDEQIADALGCRPGTVRSSISRALGVLRDSTEFDDEAEAMRRAMLHAVPTTAQTLQ